MNATISHASSRETCTRLATTPSISLHIENDKYVPHNTCKVQCVQATRIRCELPPVSTSVLALLFLKVIWQRNASRAGQNLEPVYWTLSGPVISSFGRIPKCRYRSSNALLEERLILSLLRSRVWYLPSPFPSFVANISWEIIWTIVKTVGSSEFILYLRLASTVVLEKTLAENRWFWRESGSTEHCAFAASLSFVRKSSLRDSSSGHCDSVQSKVNVGSGSSTLG